MSAVSFREYERIPVVEVLSSPAGGVRISVCEA